MLSSASARIKSEVAGAKISNKVINEAAIKVQSIWRKYKARQGYQKCKQDLIKKREIEISEKSQQPRWLGNIEIPQLLHAKKLYDAWYILNDCSEKQMHIPGALRTVKYYKR